MTNKSSKIILVFALFCGTVLADDGNMGSGGRTGCGGMNPPPECACNEEVPPPDCGSFANVSTTTDETEPVVDPAATLVNEVADAFFMLI